MTLRAGAVPGLIERRCAFVEGDFIADAIEVDGLVGVGLGKTRRVLLFDCDEAVTVTLRDRKA